MKDTNLWINRRYLAQQPFSIELVHRLGMQMVMADFLSCLPEQGELSAGTAPGHSQAVGICGMKGALFSVGRVGWSSKFLGLSSKIMR